MTQNLCKFGERVRNTAKKEDWFTAATNGRVHVSTLITTMYLRLWIPLTPKVSKSQNTQNFIQLL